MAAKIPIMTEEIEKMWIAKPSDFDNLNSLIFNTVKFKKKLSLKKEHLTRT